MFNIHSSFNIPMKFKEKKDKNIYRRQIGKKPNLKIL